MRLRTEAYLWGLGCVAFYALGAARTVQWADASKLTLYALAGHLPSLNPGDHPGWTALAWLWLRLLPHNPVSAAHWLSVLAGGISVGLLWQLLWDQGCQPARVRAGTTLWGLAHAPWWAAEVAESYALAFALVLACWLADAREKPFSSGLLAGWAAATHGLSLFLTLQPLLRRQDRGYRWLGALAGSWPLWLALFLPTRPDPLTGQHSTGGATVVWHWQAFFSFSRWAKGAALLIALVAFNLGPVGLRGILARGQARTFPALALGGLSIFLAGYAPFRLHLMAGFLVLGLLLFRPPLLGRGALLLHGLCQGATYLGIPLVLSYLGLGNLGLRQLPGRDNSSYFLCPVKTFETSARAYSRELFTSLPPSAVVLADFNPGAVLKLQQATLKARPDVTVWPTVVDDTLAAPDPAAALAQHIRRLHDQGRPVVLADRYERYYHLSRLAALGFDLRPCGPGILVADEQQGRGLCGPDPTAPNQPREGMRRNAPGRNGAPTGTRTPNLLIRSQMLYPIELSARLRQGKYNANGCRCQMRPAHQNRNLEPRLPVLSNGE